MVLNKFQLLKLLAPTRIQGSDLFSCGIILPFFDKEIEKLLDNFLKF
jgi:hypothetical protein